MSTETATIPTLTTVADTAAKLNELAEHHDWVSVFWDRGWGDSGQTAQISIIVGGNGHDPRAYLTPEVYRELRDQKIVGDNVYLGYKKRRVHDFKTPPVEEKAGPTSNEIAETVIRGVLADLADKPILVRFWRGLGRDSFGHPRTNEEVVTTAACGAGWFVQLIPGCSDVAYCAKGAPEFFGPGIIGGGIADSLPYPTGDDGDVDLEALAGVGFRAELVKAIGDKLAAIDQARAAAK